MSRLVLDDAAVISLLRRADIVQEFTFLSGAAEKVRASGKGCRCKGKQRHNQADLEGVKTAIGQLDQAMGNKLKSMLGVSEIRVNYRNFRNQTVRRTI